jgi:hypothetical protein
VSEIPLDVARLVNMYQWKYVLGGAYVLTMVFWFYWRIWFFLTSVMWSVAFRSKSFVNGTDCLPGYCTWWETPDRIPFLLLLGILFALNLVWFDGIFKKARRQFFGNRFEGGLGQGAGAVQGSGNNKRKGKPISV